MLESVFFIIVSALALNGLALGNYLCDKERLGCNSSQVSSPPKSELRTVAFEEERFRMIRSGMCRGETEDEKLNFCLGRKGSETFKSSNCFCDDNCHSYHDCCIDRAFPDDVGNSKDYTCNKLPFPNLNYYIYMIQKCPPKWEEYFVRSLCEEEATVLQEQGKYFTHLQAVPVHSMWTNLFYRNVYCAACNGDIGLTKWKTYIHCNGQESCYTMETDQVFNFASVATYGPSKDNWRIQIGNSTKTCRLIVEEFKDWDKLSRIYGARRCKPSIDICPADADAYQRRMCQEYTSYVYEKKPTNGKLKAIYKNFHCALCNVVPVDHVSCRDPTDPVLYSIPKEFHLPLLFDFSFIDQRDSNQVGSSFSACDMQKGQIWDPVLRNCLNVTCGKTFKREGNKCVRQIEGGIDSECLRAVLTSDLFVLMENGTIYVNYSRKYFQKDQYEVLKEQNGSLLEVSVCAEEGQVELFPGLEWLSEITVSISTVCLILHLAAYAVLPKLRNLPGKILMSLSSSLLCGHIFLLVGRYLKQERTMCQIFGMITHFGYLSTFCWMCVMAFDIHRTFTSSTTRSNPNSTAFVRYSAFGWLTPFTIVAVATIVDHTAPDSAFRPNYGSVVCWINQKKALLVFFGVPVGIFLLINTILFVTTAVSIRKVSKQTRMVNKFSEKIRYYLYIKLAVVLGLTWVFGFLAAILRIGALWYPFVILNGLQGALIFFFFTFKRKVLHMLVVKLKLRSHKYKMSKDSAGKKVLYSSLSNLTTLQTTLTSTVAPVLSGSPEMLKAVRRIESKANTTKL